ncbi:hypothetical protein [Streptomyces sp. NPDC001348]
MRSVRMILATAAATAALAVAAPGAHAYGGDSNHDNSSYSKERGDDSSHDEGRGGGHSGGGKNESNGDDEGSDRGDSRFDPDSYKDDEHGDDGGWSKEKDHDKPRGGMHTGGGALAAPGVTAAGLSVVAVAATGMYALRRRKVGGPVS